jgi:hypothetical protein
MTTGFYFVGRNAIPEDDRRRLVDGVLASQFYGDSALGVEFVDTRGFSVVFKRSAMDAVAANFSYLAPVLESVLFQTSNAFYINPLVLRSQSRVDDHIDCRLVPGTTTRIIPNLVSVYYAAIPADMRGGQLVLNTGHQNEVTLSPQTGDVVHFLGSTVHHVEEVSCSDYRISIVCEQYNLADDLLTLFPECEVITGASDLARLNAL